MYRFLATPRWIGYALGTLALAAIMVALGLWQLDRYELRHGINTRIDSASRTAPVDATSVMRPDRSVGAAGEWTRVRLTGVYAADKVVLARSRTVDGSVGFEVLVPLVRPDGPAVLVDRGWVPPARAGELAAPTVPPLPTGTVTVTGRVHTPESEADAPVPLDGGPSVRRIDPAKLAGPLGLTLYPDYVLADDQAGFTSIAADHEPSWMNAGYTVQWWLFALLTLFGFGWAARREAAGTRPNASTDRHRSKDRLADTADAGSLL